MRFFLSVLSCSLVLTSCSPRYMIDPDREIRFEVDGKKAQKAESEGCEVIAYSVKNEFQDLIAHVQVLNKSGADITVTPSQFSLSGPALRGDTLNAVEPAAYLSKLLSEADTLQKRTQMNTWQGVDTLTRTLPSAEGKKDRNIEKVRGEYEESKEQKKKDLQRAADLRKKEQILKNRLFGPMTVKNGREVRGEILLPGPFEREGKVTLNLNHPKCSASLPFTLND